MLVNKVFVGYLAFSRLLLYCKGVIRVSGRSLRFFKAGRKVRTSQKTIVGNAHRPYDFYRKVRESATETILILEF